MNTLNSEGIEKREYEKKDSSTQVREGEREENDLKFQNIFRCMECTM